MPSFFRQLAGVSNNLVIPDTDVSYCKRLDQIFQLTKPRRAIRMPRELPRGDAVRKMTTAIASIILTLARELTQLQLLLHQEQSQVRRLLLHLYRLSKKWLTDAEGGQELAQDSGAIAQPCEQDDQSTEQDELSE